MEDMIPACPLRQEQLPQPEHGGEELEPEAAEDEAGSTSELCLSNQLYIDSGNDKKVLYLLCIGLTDNSGTAPLFFLNRNHGPAFQNLRCGPGTLIMLKKSQEGQVSTM
jgi:hypothetical protein